MLWNFRKGYNFFVFDPEVGGIAYFKTADERDRYAADCIHQYPETDGWAEDVVSVVAAVVTHSAQQIGLEDRPDNLDEYGCDDDGTYWERDCEYRCNYKLLPVDSGQDGTA